MAAYLTDEGRRVLLRDDPTTDVLRIILVSTPPASQAAANTLLNTSDVVANELSGTGYGRQTLGSVAVTKDVTNHWAKLGASNPAAYTGLNAGTLVGAWIIKRVGGSDVDANDLLIMFLGCTSLITNGGDVTVTFDPNGLMTFA